MPQDLSALVAQLRERRAVHSSYSGKGRVELVRGDAADPLCRVAATALEAQAAEIAQLRAALEVSQAATDAAVKKAQWQAVTNAELNALQDEVRKLKKAACQRFNEQFDDEPKL